LPIRLIFSLGLFAFRDEDGLKDNPFATHDPIILLYYELFDGFELEFRVVELFLVELFLYVPGDQVS